MLPFKISTKWITIEVYRRGIVFTVASILLTSGVTLCNEKILMALISIINKQVFNSEPNNLALFIGFTLIVISLLLFYLLIINWRKEIYSKVFLEIRKAVDSFGTAWRTRIRYASSTSLRELHTQAYNDYLSGFNFLRDNQTIIDVECYEKAWELLNKIGEEILELDTYIKVLEKKENNESINYDPEKANKESQRYVDVIIQLYKEFVIIIKEKEKYRIK
ncbi:hypothetical protein CLV31_1312 [Algoriphagus aquaeductus]|uniref:Uncharacterized protein n=1 Tax=Algoriphagus aquaeductus TaxID=475299 RepID=A0A326RI65_9BACT|nr:hypothetical protein [Algoriphagus aquaeductus]PZV75490.1 hypothetical protein CLV31_1312 [Algoriphagus aquaeductus]